MSMLRTVRSIGGKGRGLSEAPALRALAVWGPGILVMLADTDAGNVVAAAQGGALWGYRLLPLILLLIPMLYLVQELTARLGVYTGRGHAELIRERYGFGWALVAVAGLAAAAIGSLVTEFTGVAGIGEMFGLPRASPCRWPRRRLLAIVGRGRIAGSSGRRSSSACSNWRSSSSPGRRVRASRRWRGDAVRLPFGDRQFLYMVAAIIGATFNPWMVFYQQSATVDKRLQPADLRHARVDTAVGAVADPVPDRRGADRRRGDASPTAVRRRASPASAKSARALTPALGATMGGWSSAPACSAPRWSRRSSRRWRSPGASARSPATSARWRRIRSPRAGSMASMLCAWSAPPSLSGRCRTSSGSTSPRRC